MNLYDLAAKIYLKNLDVKYITDDKRKHVAGLAADAIDAASIFIEAMNQRQAKAWEAPSSEKEQQLEPVTPPESEL